VALPALRKDRIDNHGGSAPAGGISDVEKVHDSFAWSQSEALRDPSNGVGD
jgi:hypothetical protein